MKETPEELRGILKGKEDELARLTAKAAEFQTRLDRVSKILKKEEHNQN